MTQETAVKRRRRGLLFLIDALSLWILGPLTFAACLASTLYILLAGNAEDTLAELADGLRLSLIGIPEFLIALTIVKLMRELYLMRARRRTAPKIKFFPIDHQCWWYATKQSNGVYITAINVDMNVENTSDKPLMLLRSRVFEPKHGLEILKEGITAMPEGFPEFSSEHAIPPGSKGKVVAHLMLRGLMESITVTVPAVMEVNDQYQNRHRFKVLLKCRNKEDALKDAKKGAP